MKVANCFFALPLPEEEITRFVELVGALKEMHLPVRFQKTETAHLTLLYLGTVHEDKLSRAVEHIREIASQTRPFAVTVTGCGHFGSARYPRVVWLGAAATDALTGLQNTIREQVANYAEKKDDRPFHAHLTIARISSAKGYSAAQPDVEARCSRYTFRFQADRIRLYTADQRTGERQIPSGDFLFSQ